jgi:dethiobiotin synthetase
MRGVFVTGTDTGAGKTVLAATICAGLRARGDRVAAFKPVLTGTAEPRDPVWPPDDELLARAAGVSAGAVVARRFEPAVSPHLAAELAGAPIDPAALLAEARAASAAADVLVAEGVGGLLVPITLDYSVRDLARALGLPVVVAARPGLGTISHTLLTVEAARAAGLDVRGIVLTPWPQDPGEIERSNRETIERLSGVRVSVLGELAGPEPRLLAAACEALPAGEWVGPGAVSRTHVPDPCTTLV